MSNVSQFPCPAHAVPAPAAKPRRSFWRFVKLCLLWFVGFNVAMLALAVAVVFFMGFTGGLEQAVTQAAAERAAAPAAVPAAAPAAPSHIERAGVFAPAAVKSLQVDCRVALKSAARFGIDVGMWQTGTPPVLHAKVSVKNAHGEWQDGVGVCVVDAGRITEVRINLK